MSPTDRIPRLVSATRRQIVIGGLASALSIPAIGRTQELAPDGFRILRARRGTAALRGADKPPTPIWGYDGGVPGPLIRLRRGEEVKVRLVNDLAEPTTIHWHGVRVPNAMDGVPHMTQPPVEPGGQFDYRFVVPDAGTFWYHAHQFSSEQKGRGLYGPLVVDEPEPLDVDRDVTLMLDDWRLSPAGTIEDSSFRSMHDAAHAGRIGEHMTVNGLPILDVPVKTNERLRLRLVNAANARIFALRLDGHRPVVVSVDGQPAEPFAARNARVVLGPGTRVDLLVDAALAPGATAAIVAEVREAEVPLVRLVYGDAPARPAPRGEVKPLPANPLPERMDFPRALRLDMPLDGGAMSQMMMDMMRRGGPERHEGFAGAPIWALAGKPADGHSGPPLFSVKRGRTVVLAIPNRTAFPHAMHIHGHHFRLLDNLDDGWKPFWLDSVTVMPRETARIAFVADNPGKWMIHCHMLEHQETGMAAWFEVG